MRTDVDVLIKALLILSTEIESEDGIANACLAEAAAALHELNEEVKLLRKNAHKNIHGEN